MPREIIAKEAIILQGHRLEALKLCVLVCNKFIRQNKQYTAMKIVIKREANQKSSKRKLTRHKSCKTKLNTYVKWFEN